MPDTDTGRECSHSMERRQLSAYIIGVARIFVAECGGGGLVLLSIVSFSGIGCLRERPGEVN